MTLVVAPDGWRDMGRREQDRGGAAEEPRRGDEPVPPRAALRGPRATRIGAKRTGAAALSSGDSDSAAGGGSAVIAAAQMQESGSHSGAEHAGGPDGAGRESVGVGSRGVGVTGSCWEVARILEPHVDRVIVASPDDTGIAQARAKTDRLGARTLARLLWAGELESVWMPDESSGCCDAGWRGASNWCTRARARRTRCRRCYSGACRANRLHGSVRRQRPTVARRS